MVANKYVFLGPVGTYSQLALTDYDSSAETSCARTIAEIFQKVISSDNTFGFVPLENMIQGPVAETLDLLLEHKGKVVITDSYLMTINNAFGVLPKELCGASWPREITHIYSHEQALRQCSKYILQNFPHAQQIPTTSTAAGIEYIKAQGLTGAASIAPATSLKSNGFLTVKEEIADIPGNKTRFVVIKKAENYKFSKRTSENFSYVTSILIAPGRDRQGLLFEILNIISIQNKKNIITIHSRPDLKGRVVFYLDIEGSYDEIENCLQELRDFCFYATGSSAEVVVLGSYRYLPFYIQPIHKVGIIGVNGVMGQWFRKFFEENGFSVIGSDLNTKTTNKDVVNAADTILLSVPMSEAISVAKEIAPQLKPGQLIVENCSIKSFILPLLSEIVPAGVEVMGLHTMFAGDLLNLHGENAIITKTNTSGEKAQAFEDLLYKHGAKISYTTSEEHDAVASFVQSLIQLNMVILADTMKNSFENIHELDFVSTPNFRNTLNTISRVLNQSENLILDLQTLNYKSPDIRNRYLESAFKLCVALNNGDVETFSKTVQEVKKFLSK
ncbi:MAG: prephenate dehydrogenase/arogenate dehydrogenase family protein [Proteobacteria bacterium]|nr:prephenate dehydrogenase/arogenate dehydrogenase family protein [Pseudomonadota bacterium]